MLEMRVARVSGDGHKGEVVDEGEVITNELRGCPGMAIRMRL